MQKKAKLFARCLILQENWTFIDLNFQFFTVSKLAEAKLTHVQPHEILQIFTAEKVTIYCKKNLNLLECFFYIFNNCTLGYFLSQ